MPEDRTKTCPFCAMDVSPGVTLCPNCGGMIAPDTSTTQPEPESDRQTFQPAQVWTPSSSARPGGSKGVLVGVGVAVALLVVGVVAVIGFVGDQGGQGRIVDGPPPIVIDMNQPISGVIDNANSSRLYEFQMPDRGIVNIRVTGDFDNYLELYRDRESSPMDEDDDSAGDLNAQVTNILEAGTYYVLVRAYSEGTTGSFTLYITGQGGTNVTRPTPQAVPQQHRQGVVAAVSGSPPVSTSQTCDIYITASEPQSSLNCRIRVFCGGSVIYGRDAGSTRYGYNQCMVTSTGAAVIVEAHDRGVSSSDGDPRIDMNTAQGEIIITESLWSVTVRFTSPADNAAPPTR